MTEEMNPLLEAFYTEVEPEVRKKQLEEYIQSNPEDPVLDYRKALYDARHFNRKRPDHAIDTFLWNLISLSALHRSPGLFPKRHRKEVLSILRKMELDDRPRQDSKCEEALYWEYRNAMRRFLASCEDPSYGRKLFGMVSPDKGSRERQRCDDMWGFSYGIAEMTKTEEEMSLLCRAANDEYVAKVTNAASLKADHDIYNKK